MTPLKRRRNLLLILLVVLCVLGGVAFLRGSAGSPTLYGFTPRSSVAERSIERRFLAIPSSDQARAAHAFLTAEPHVAGSPRDRALAEWVRDRWREYGLDDVAIQEHRVLLPYPIAVSVEMTGPTPWRASLKEDPVEGDPFSTQGRRALLSRVLGFRRGDSRSRLRRQRQPRRLRLARRARHRHQGKDRPRALLGALQLSRLQGAHGPAPRRGGHPHLLRSGRRRVREGEGVSGRAVGA